MKKKLLALSIIAASFGAQAEWEFRGTPNGWDTTALDYVSGDLFETCQSFADSDPRFKIDRFGDWNEAYPTADYIVAGNKTYNIKFYADSHNIEVAEVANCDGSVDPGDFAQNFASLNFRGTPNSWAAGAMTLVADNTWEITVSLNGQADQRFKFDVLGDWSENYGDTGADGYLDQAGTDIYTAASGDYKIQVNDATKHYTLTRVGDCTTGCEQPVGETLGAVYSADSTTFSIWSPDHSDVKVSVNGTEHNMSKVADFAGYNNVYQVTVSGDLHLAQYTFKINGNQVRDPYGKMAKPGTGDYEAVNIVMDMSETDPVGGWAARPALIEREDAIIYEMHVRDFTIDSSSGVSAGNHGKFAGLVEAGTTYNGVKTGIDHLKELGVTHVQLLPVYDYATCDGLPDSNACYNWGYDPRNFNIPEDRYSKVPTNYEERAREFKTMVNEFHKAGIRVIMDVVYNHTYNKAMFENISGQYYTATDLSGTGNSVNTNIPMVSRLVQDSLEYWVDEYNIDGFRFDLIGIFNYADAQQWGKNINDKFAERNILMYGEPWNGYASDPDFTDDYGNILRVRYGTTHNMVDGHVGVFNGAYREAIKGKNDTPECAFMCNNMDNGNVADGWGIYDGMKGSPYDPNDSRNGEWFRNFAADPEQTINYISAHDNFGLWDKTYLAFATNVSQNSSHQIEWLTPPADLGYAKRVVNFGMGMVLTSQGIPFIHSGDEFLRTKTNNQDISNPSAWNYGEHGGTHNTYNAPDSFNAIHWGNKIANAGTFEYFKTLINLRRSHAGMRMNTNQEIAQHMVVDRPDTYGGHVVSAYITYPEDNQNLYIVYNNGNNVDITLPSGSWTKVADANGETSVSGLSGTAVVEGTSVTIFTQ